MDPLITKLNQAAQQKLAKAVSPVPAGNQEPSLFQKTLDNNFTDRVMDKLREDYALDPKNTMNVISADDVHVTSQSQELAENQSNPGNKMADAFKGMNRDLVNLDATIETLMTPGVHLTPPQLLALQAGVAHTGLMGDVFSKVVESINSGIKQVIQTQV